MSQLVAWNTALASPKMGIAGALRGAESKQPKDGKY